MSTLAPLHKHRGLHCETISETSPVEHAQAPNHASLPAASSDAPLSSTSRAPEPVDGVAEAGDGPAHGHVQPGRELDGGVEGGADAGAESQDEAASIVQTMPEAMQLQPHQVQQGSHRGGEAVCNGAQALNVVEAANQEARQASTMLENDESSMFDDPTLMNHHHRAPHDPQASSAPLFLFEPRHQARASTGWRLGDDQTSYTHVLCCFDSACLECDSRDQVRSAVRVRSSKHGSPPALLPVLRGGGAHEWAQAFGVTHHQYSRTQSLNQVRGTLSDFKSQLGGTLQARHGTSQAPSRISTSSLSRAHTSLGWVKHGSRGSSEGGWTTDYRYTDNRSHVNLDIAQNNSSKRQDGRWGTGPRTPPMSPRFSRGKSGSSSLLPRLPTGLSVSLQKRAPASEWARVSS